jgi:hypothetical protein
LDLPCLPEQNCRSLKGRIGQLQNRFFGKLEMHAVNEVSREFCSPIPTVPIEKREEKKVTSMS